MKGAVSRCVVVMAGLLLAACSAPDSGEPAAASAPPTVFGVMTDSIIPQSNLVWEQAGNLYDDDGNIDAARLTEQQWNEVADAAQAMSAGAKQMAETTGIKVAPEGAMIQGEGTEGAASAAEVQAAMDADPRGFREQAMQLATVADEIVAAARARDGTKTDDLSARLSEVCGDCHAQFWYPKQPQ